MGVLDELSDKANSLLDKYGLNNVVSFRKAQDGSHTGFVDSYGSYRVTITLSQVSENNEFLHLIQKLYKVLGTNLRMPISVSALSIPCCTMFIILGAVKPNDSAIPI